MAKRLLSAGGRPGLKGANRRTKIPLGDHEWKSLERLAKSMSKPGFSPSAGQVASMLVTLSLNAIASNEKTLG
ncbi:MAG: hypothetical protein L0215_11420 [Gemmataceae bacterium]|nr:hypothetical protein [Gemmataceae bacterium]